MDKQDFQKQDFMEILVRLPWYVPGIMRLMATIYANARDHTRVRTAASARMRVCSPSVNDGMPYKS